MIPESSWKFIWRWWWLLGICFLLGTAAAYYLAHSLVAYESLSALEVTYLVTPDGKVSVDEVERRREANLLSQELSGPWATGRVAEALAKEGIPPSALRQLDISISGPSVLKERIGPPIISITVSHPDPRVAKRASEVAAVAFAEYVQEKHLRYLKLRLQQAQGQVDSMEPRLLEVLQAKRRILDEEAEKVRGSAATLLAAHERLLRQLPGMVDSLRLQVGLSAPAGNADAEELDRLLAELRIETTALGEEWQEALAPALKTLYAVEGSPGYQLALAQEIPIRQEYASALKLFATVSTNSPDVSPVVVLQKGSEPDLVSVLGMPATYLLGFGAIGGLAAAWVLGNFLEYFLTLRARWRGTQARPPQMRPEAAD